MIFDLRFSILDCRQNPKNCDDKVQSRAVFPNRKSAIENLKSVGVAVLLLLAGRVHAADAPRWQQDWERVVEAAKREGQVSLYGGQEITHPDIIAAFNKEFPFIKVLSVAGRAADLMTRIVAERRADKYLADVMASGPNGPRMLYLAKALDPISSTFILPEVTDASKWYGAKHWYADPENQHIFMFEGTKDTEITLFRDRAQGTNWLANGKFPLCLLCRDIDKAAKQGLPVDDIAPDQLKEGSSVGGGGSSVLVFLNRAPHPNAAKVFINWYLSRQGQMVWQNVMNKKEVEPSDSMRIDIPKDDVLPEARRADGKKYHVVGFLDPDPVQKLLQEILK